ncbi:MAG: hypothetical protein HRU06_04510 [Oceanospirillaceae bacterium]|nr:hypothetical protein [Oceanospirillaceae bacterium]
MTINSKTDVTERLGSINALSKSILIVSCLLLSSCASTFDDYANAQDCTEQWYNLVEQQLSMSDAAGHGPDLGSDEWRSAVEMELQITENNNLPAIESETWCSFIHNSYIAPNL